MQIRLPAPIASASSSAAAAAPSRPAGGSRVARPSSSSSAARTPRAANRRASSGCTPACSSAQAVRGGTSRVTIVIGGRAIVSSQAFEHGVRLVRLPAPAQALQQALRPGLEAGGAALAAQGQGGIGAGRRGRSPRRRAAARPRPRRPSRRRAAARAATRRRSARRPPSTACARPQPLSQNEFTTGSPRASRASFTGWAWKTSWASLCSRRMRRPTAERVSPSQRSTLRPITRSSEAVAKPSSSSWPTYQRSGAPQAAAKPSLSNSSRIASKSARDSASPRPSAGRVEHGGVVAAEQPVRRCHQAPGALADGHAVGPGGMRGEGQGAVAAAPAAGGGEGALVRRREAVGRAFVAGRGLEPRQQAREVRQGEVAKHVPAGFRIVGSEGNEQVHGADYPGADAWPEAQASRDRMLPVLSHVEAGVAGVRRSYPQNGGWIDSWILLKSCLPSAQAPPAPRRALPALADGPGLFSYARESATQR